MVNITTTNFLTHLHDLLSHLPSASFISIDEEMTGIQVSDGGKLNKAELPCERYKRWKEASERYSVIQVGVALFFRNDKFDSANGADDANRGDANGDGGVDGANGGVAREEEMQDPPDDNEHSFMHREGALNQDELEDLTEREGEAPRRDSQDNGDVNEDNGDVNNEDEEHAFMHREGALNQDELEDLTEREDHPNNSVEVGEYTSRIYNFYLFPNSSKDITMSCDTIQFLLRNKMDFNKVFSEGISYRTVCEAKGMKSKFLKKKSRKEGNENGDGMNGVKKSGERVKLTRTEDVAFVARAMASLREWIDACENGNDGGEAEGVDPDTGVGRRRTEGSSLVLPPCNAFLRRCLYETIEDEYPGLVLERADTSPNAGVARNQIRVIRLTSAEKKRREERLLQEEWSKILYNIGFTTVFQAISDACHGRRFSEQQTDAFFAGESSAVSTEESGRKIPLVVHNGMMDLLFLLTHCHGASLPDSFEDAKKLIGGYFPLIYDTKIMSTECSDAVVRGGSTALGDLYNSVFSSEMNDLELKKATITNGDCDEQAHEAAWDAYMTGCVFYALGKKILEPIDKSPLFMDKVLKHEHVDSLHRDVLGLNKLYMHMSLYSIDLESSSGPEGLNDPLSHGLSVETTFYVTGIDTTVSTRDILRALTDGSENEPELLQHLKYEIIWMDDESFFVGTKLDNLVSTGDSDMIQSIALHVHNRLHAGLNSVQISDLVEYFQQKKMGNGSIIGSFASAVKRLLGGVACIQQVGDDGHGKKRRRLN